MSLKCQYVLYIIIRHQALYLNNYSHYKHIDFLNNNLNIIIIKSNNYYTLHKKVYSDVHANVCNEIKMHDNNSPG